MQRIIILVVIVIALSGCALAQPYASLYQPPNPQPTPQRPQIATSAATARAVCKVDVILALNLRSAPGTSYSVIGTLYPGDILTMTGNQRDAWREVITGGGVIGWVNSNYCKGK